MLTLIIAILAVALVFAAFFAFPGAFTAGVAPESWAEPAPTVPAAGPMVSAKLLQSESSLILDGADRFQFKQHRWPTAVAELKVEGFVPTGVDAVVLKDGVYTELGWHLQPKSGDAPYIVMTESAVPADVCQAFNALTRGDDGILLQAFDVLPAQCYGTGGVYKVVVRVGRGSIEGLLPDPVALGELPARSADGWWAVRPTARTALATVEGIDSTLEKPEEPQLSMSGGPVNFGSVPLGTTRKVQGFVVRNVGKSAIAGLTLVAPETFQIVDSTCGNTLGHGASCGFSIEFQPVDPLWHGGAVVVMAAGYGVKAKSVIEGTGVSL